MKKSSSKIRNEIAKLEAQLKVAQARDAERIGRVALKAGLGDIVIDEPELQAAFENVAKRFRGGQGGSTVRERAGANAAGISHTETISSRANPGIAGEA